MTLPDCEAVDVPEVSVLNLRYTRIRLTRTECECELLVRSVSLSV